MRQAIIWTNAALGGDELIHYLPHNIDIMDPSSPFY